MEKGGGMKSDVNRDPIAGKKQREEISVLTSPHWLGAFVAISVVTSFVPFLIGFMLGLTVANDSVFGTYALVSGGFADFIIRSKFGIVLLVLPKPKIPFIMFWVLLSLYVIVFKPFQ